MYQQSSTHMEVFLKNDGYVGDKVPGSETIKQYTIEQAKSLYKEVDFGGNRMGSFGKVQETQTATQHFFDGVLEIGGVKGMNKNVFVTEKEQKNKPEFAGSGPSITPSINNSINIQQNYIDNEHEIQIDRDTKTSDSLIREGEVVSPVQEVSKKEVPMEPEVPQVKVVKQPEAPKNQGEKANGKGKNFISKSKQMRLEKELSRQYGQWRIGKIEKKESFLSVPIELIDTTYLSDSERCVFLKVLKFAKNETGVTFVSDARLIKETGKSRATIQRALDSLEEKKMLRRLTVSTKDRKICLLPYPVELYEGIINFKELEE